MSNLNYRLEVRLENKISLATLGQRLKAGVLDYLIILPSFLYLVDKLVSFLTEDIFYIYFINDSFFLLYFILLQKIYSKTLGMRIFNLEMKRHERTAATLKQILIHNTPILLFCLMELWNLQIAINNLPELASRSNIELNL